MAKGDYEKMKKMMDDMSRSTGTMLKNQEEMEKGIGNVAKAYKDIHDITKSIIYEEEKLKKGKEELAEFEKKNLESKVRWEKILLKGTDKGKLKAKEKLEILKSQLKVQKAIVFDMDLKLKKDKEGLETLKKTVTEARKLKALRKSMVKGTIWGFDKLKQWGVFKMDKEIRNASRSMGIGRDASEAFATNIHNASNRTAQWGVNAGELAKMQQSYSEEIGRSVQLTEDGFEAMALMAEGTGLGATFASSLAADMDNFGVSVITSKGFVEETMKTAAKMGVNSSKALKSLQKNLKLAQRFHFKGGVKGLTTMANEASRLKLDMDGIAGVAEKVFRPEGAVEMAAQLATMGGEFAKLGDPFELMFNARNDPAKFAKKIGAATSEFIDFNEKTGEFNIKGGLAADRMREIAKITGLSVEKLQEMGVAQKRMEKIGSITPISISDDDAALLGTISKFENGEMVIDHGDFHSAVKDLKAGDMERIRAEDQSLEKRAKQSRTFQEDMEDIWLSIQQLLLPVARSLKKNLGDPLKKLTADWESNGYYKAIQDFVNVSADLVLGIGKFVIEGARLLGPKGTLMTGLALYFGAKAAMWAANGAMLGIGFNKTAMVGGGGGGRGAGSMFGSMGTKTRRFTKAGGGLSGKMGSAGRGMAGRGMGIGMAGMAGGMALNYGRDNMLDDRNSTGGKWMGVGAGALQGAGTGAMIGSIIPGIGTAAGAGIGGLIGGGAAAFNEFGGEDNGNAPIKMKFGGRIKEHIKGIGKSGQSYEFGEDNVNETVTPDNKKGGSGSGKVKHHHTVSVNVNITGDVPGIDKDEFKKEFFASIDWREVAKKSAIASGTALAGGVERSSVASA